MADAEFGSQVLVAAVACGSKILNVDAVSYDRKIWLVPAWLDRDEHEWSRPLRMIRIDDHPHRRSVAQWDIVVTEPLPEVLLNDPKATDARYEIFELPPVVFPKRRGTSA